MRTPSLGFDLDLLQKILRYEHGKHQVEMGYMATGGKYFCSSV